MKQAAAGQRAHQQQAAEKHKQAIHSERLQRAAERMPEQTMAVGVREVGSDETNSAGEDAFPESNAAAVISKESLTLLPSSLLPNANDQKN